MDKSVKENIEPLIRKLEVSSVLRQLPDSYSHELDEELDEREVGSLCGYSSILSLSDSSDNISLAYEIITRLVEHTKGENQKVLLTADMVFSRIGNFPGRTLLRERHRQDIESGLSARLKLESLGREVENTFYIDSERSALLTDFQYKLLDSLGEEDALSFSAPTSAGKSYALNLDLMRKIQSGTGQSIVYVVPTRALISEVSSRIRESLRLHKVEDVKVRTAPFAVERDKIKHAVIYVLTQERLMSFLNSTDNEPFVTTLIVDEAHEIQNGKRGIVLHNAIEIALAKYSGTRVLFASPLISNPGYFLSVFNKLSNGRYFVETVSPVSQNIILVNEVQNKPRHISVALIAKSSLNEIGEIETNFRFRDGKIVQRANLALSICQDNESVISYSNEPAQAEKIACQIAMSQREFEPDDDVVGFIEFIKRDVHPEYPLAMCLEKGVAFHYGKMPSLVRSAVERLFKNGSIKIICCTSTLLQGVNLPAKHIIIENPLSGDQPMTRADFLNLSGRAGRLLHEFHGNIWCIRPSEWRSDCFQGDDLQEISSAMSNVMEDGGVIVQDLINQKQGDSNNKDLAEATLGKLYHDYLVEQGDGFLDKYRNEDNEKDLANTYEALQKIEVYLPLEIIQNHQSLRPDHLQRLYNRLNSMPIFEECVPMPPYAEGAKARMDEIILTVSDCFEWSLSDAYRGWICYLAYQWVWGVPIGKILSQRVGYLREKNTAKSPSTIIRDCLSVLEDAVRFRLVKYFSAYIDIVRLLAEEKGKTDEVGEIEPYFLYLEFGSFNRHVLNLMALGISRITALHIEKLFDLPSDVEPEQYLETIGRLDLYSINMSEVSRRELKDLIGE